MPSLDPDQLLDALRDLGGPPVTARELGRRLGVPRERQATLRRVLKGLVTDGRLVVLGGHRLALPSQLDVVQGRLHGHASGLAFVRPEHGGPDILVPASRRSGALHGDLVTVRVDPASHPRSGAEERPSGAVVAVRERRATTLVGRARRDRRGGVLVEPFDARIDALIQVAGAGALDATDGDMVSVEITRWPGPAGDATGRIVEVLGPPEAAGVDTAVVLRKHDIPEEHSADAIEEARRAPATVTSRDITGRTDFRGDLVVTIDGEHARDFDDAVSVRRLPGGLFQLAVHIADVAHYVSEGSALDLDAFDRGTSVYFPDRAVHMFPSALATGVCSLNPAVDRLVQSCVMDIDAHGAVVRYELHDGVIHSRARLTYTAVNAMVAGGDAALRAAHADVVPMLDLLRELFDALHGRRVRRGSIDFDLPEAEVVLDASGAIEDIVASERNIAHRLIEECMLVANETVAAHLERFEMPALYRVHEAPDPVRVAEFEAFLTPLGVGLETGRSPLHPRHFQSLVERIRDTPAERAVAFQMLRTMQKARYEAENLGHFGLAAHTYTHFTSPIRRYPDLIVHRVLRELRHGEADAERRAELAESLPEIARHASAMERRAQEAERELLQWKKVRFMADKIGESFVGHVTGAAPFGLFVQLDEHFVEGLLHASALSDDVYRFDAQARVWFAPRTQRVLGVGDTLRVRVARVDLDKRQIDLTPDDRVPSSRGASAKAAPRQAKRLPAKRRSAVRPGKHERARRKGRR